jgi:hypothetical protein
MAVEYYRSLGGTDFVKLGKAIRPQVASDGVERHVEVKGSSLLIETVELTPNGVDHARDFQPTDLVGVDGIGWRRQGSAITTSGGRLRTWRDRAPAEHDLAARKYAYILPAKG